MHHIYYPFIKTIPIKFSPNSNVFNCSVIHQLFKFYYLFKSSSLSINACFLSCFCNTKFSLGLISRKLIKCANKYRIEFNLRNPADFFLFNEYHCRFLFFISISIFHVNEQEQKSIKHLKAFLKFYHRSEGAMCSLRD